MCNISCWLTKFPKSVAIIDTFMIKFILLLVQKDNTWNIMLQLNCYVKQEDKMDNLNIATNIVNLRKQKEVTQEELASFIGVTKASVSKWENGQSMPDIMLLPILASYFEVTIDELIGYKPMLSREQIRLLYKTFAESFSKEPFEELDSAIAGLLNPAFEIIKDRPEFERISSLLKEAKDK